MYLKRKIDKILDDWLANPSSKPALIVGIRQCGKTESIIELGKRNNKLIININFWTNPEFCNDFKDSLEVDLIISNISLRMPNIDINSKDVLIFFDEIQECPRARLALKNFAIDGRYKVIASGSYLGINGYCVGDFTPVPTGYEEVIQMKTLDFEEFLWANNYNEQHINELKKYFDQKKEIPTNIHNIYNNIFNDYVCIGGFPDVVKEFVNTKNLSKAFKKLESLKFDIQSDFGRRKGKDNKPLFKTSEVARIQNCFDLIPTFLSKENKRFVTSKIQTGSSAEKSDAIEYLRQAHIVNKVFNVEVPSLPLQGFKISSQFKLFPEDIGIVISMYGHDTLLAIHNGDLGQGKGAIFESIVFDSLSKAGFDCFYFAKETGLEIDFVISYNGSCYLVEAKSKNGNTKSAKTVMKNPDHYGPTKLIKFGEYNIGESGDTITLPHYLAFMLGK